LWRAVDVLRGVNALWDIGVCSEEEEVEGGITTSVGERRACRCACN
jgi:hypothetical protein